MDPEPDFSFVFWYYYHCHYFYHMYQGSFFPPAVLLLQLLVSNQTLFNIMVSWLLWAKLA